MSMRCGKNSVVHVSLRAFRSVSQAQVLEKHLRGAALTIGDQAVCPVYIELSFYELRFFHKKVDWYHIVQNVVNIQDTMSSMLHCLPKTSRLGGGGGLT